MEIQEKICRLCLKVCDKFKPIEDDMKDVLDVVLLTKIDLAAMREPVMCPNCTEMLIKCLDFKAACLDTFDCIVPFVNKDGVKVDLKDVYRSKSENGTGVPEGLNICGFCMGPVKDYSIIPLDFEEGNVMFKKMIEQCVPELDLSVMEKPIICEHCHASLLNCFCFVTDCLIVEEKIKKYCETIDKNSRGQIEMTGLLQFTLKDVNSEVNGSSVDLNESFMDINEPKLNSDQQFLLKSIMACKEESKNAISLTEKFCGEAKIQIPKENVEMEEQEFLANEGIEIITDEPDFNRCENVSPRPEVNSRSYRNRKGLTADLPKPRVKHDSTKNEDVTKRPYQCELCSYQAKRKYALKRHLLTHKDPSSVPMYKCNSCPFQAKRKDALKSHLLVHKDPSEIPTYKCNSCSYRANKKNNLKRHSLLHKDPSEIAMYKCSSCPYQAKWKHLLESHLMVHKDPSEIAMYKCNSCSYQSKQKGALKRHSLLHKDPSETTMYKCNSCSYQTKVKYKLNGHLLVHRDPSEIAMYKCNSCSYQTKEKCNLKRHLLLHKDPSETTMYKCNSCPYETKMKYKLNEHLLVHRDPSQVEMYRCNLCSYQAKVKNYLRKHLLVHKDRSEVKMYKCNSCSYETKLKYKLNGHQLVHKDPSEIAMYKCNYCSYQAKVKTYLKKHLSVHKSPPK